MSKRSVKQIHIHLRDDQIRDYETVREATGITNDNDLVRHLFREKARAIRREARWIQEAAAPRREVVRE